MWVVLLFHRKYPIGKPVFQTKTPVSHEIIPEKIAIVGKLRYFYCRLF